MSTAEERRERFVQQVRAELRPEVGVVDDVDCGCRLCDEVAVFRVPRTHFGGDTPYCPYHLARYRHRHTELYQQVRVLEDIPDPDVHAVVGDRFLALEEIPETLPLDDREFRRVGLGVDGNALVESAEPDDDGFVEYALLTRGLEVVEDGRIEIPRSRAGEFLVWFRDHRGLHGVDADVQDALYGGER